MRGPSLSFFFYLDEARQRGDTRGKLAEGTDGCVVKAADDDTRLRAEAGDLIREELRGRVVVRLHVDVEQAATDLCAHPAPSREFT